MLIQESECVFVLFFQPNVEALQERQQLKAKTAGSTRVKNTSLSLFMKPGAGG